MLICPKWNTLAARAASACPWAKTSRKSSFLPAPPLAMTGMVRNDANRLRASQAKPCFTPSWFMLVKSISPAPRSFTSFAQSKRSLSVGMRPPLR